MDLSYEVKDSYAEIKAAGRLNMVSAPKLREFVADVVASGSSRIVVNLEDTAFMDSSGLGALIGCLKRPGRRAATSASPPSSRR